MNVTIEGDTMNDTLQDDLVRRQSFDCTGPVELDVEIESGLVEIRLADDTATADAPAGGTQDVQDVQDVPAGGAAGQVVHVEVRHEPAAGSTWGGGLTGLLSWVGQQIGGTEPAYPAAAVRETTIAMHGNRVIVQGPKTMPLRVVPLGVVIVAPPGSSVGVRAGAGDIRVTGPANLLDVRSGSGDISADRADGIARARTGSGSIRLGPMTDGLSARSGSGDLEVAALTGVAKIGTGSGSIWLGHLDDGHVSARTGSGDLTVADAGSGVLDLVTGSGDLRVGIRAGSAAEVDVFSGSGRARSDLPVSDDYDSTAPASDAVVQVKARTGSGDAVIARATA